MFCAYMYIYIYIYIYAYICIQISSPLFRHVAGMGEGRGSYWILARKPEGKRLLGKSRRRWEDNIKLVLQKIGRVCGSG